MTATIWTLSKDLSSPHADPGTPSRTRKSHKKVRTGCKTCKLRRKKCDETRPACLRCTSTGRTCDGYGGRILSKQGNTTRSTTSEHSLDSCLTTGALETTAKRTKEDSILAIKAAASRDQAFQLHRSPNFFTAIQKLTDIERSCFSFFQYQTSPQFTAYFESSIWRTQLIKGVFAHPVLFAAATALGAVHRRFNYGISREAFEYCAHADRLHKKAVAALEDLQNETVNSNLLGTSSKGGSGGLHGISDRDVMLTCEILLALFQGFQGEHDLSSQHMRAASQYLLDTQFKLIHTETRTCAVESRPRVFCSLLHQLHCRAIQLFGSPTNILVKYAETSMMPPIPPPNIIVHWSYDSKVPKMPYKFKSMEEARDYIFTEIDWVMHNPARIANCLVERIQAQNMHAQRLINWTSAYAAWLNSTTFTDRTRQYEIHKLLGISRDATFLLLYHTFFMDVDPRIQLPPMPTFPPSTTQTNNPTTIRDPHIEPLSQYNDQNESQDKSDLTPVANALWHAVSTRDTSSINLTHIKRHVEQILQTHRIYHLDPEDPLSPNDSTYTSTPDPHSATSQALSIFGISSDICTVEEHATIEAVYKARDLAREGVDMRWVDVSCSLEYRRFLLRYFREDAGTGTGTGGGGMSWVQEWWEF